MSFVRGGRPQAHANNDVREPEKPIVMQNERLLKGSSEPWEGQVETLTLHEPRNRLAAAPKKGNRENFNIGET